MELIFYIRKQAQKTKQWRMIYDVEKNVVFLMMSTVTHLDFGGVEAGSVVHPVESNRVELALVQVDHGQLVGLVRRSQGSSEGKLELIPESLWWGAGVGAGVDRAGLVLGEGIAVGKSLKSTKRHLLIKQGRGLEKEMPSCTGSSAQLSNNDTKHTSALGSGKAPGSGHFCSRESKMMLSSCLSYVSATTLVRVA